MVVVSCSDEDCLSQFLFTCVLVEFLSRLSQRLLVDGDNIVEPSNIKSHLEGRGSYYLVWSRIL